MVLQGGEQVESRDARVSRVASRETTFIELGNFDKIRGFISMWRESRNIGGSQIERASFYCRRDSSWRRYLSDRLKRAPIGRCGKTGHSVRVRASRTRCNRTNAVSDDLALLSLSQVKSERIEAHRARKYRRETLIRSSGSRVDTRLTVPPIVRDVFGSIRAPCYLPEGSVASRASRCAEAAADPEELRPVVTLSR